MFRLLKIPCFLSTIPIRAPPCSGFFVYFALTWNQEVQNFYTRCLLSTPPSIKRPGHLFEDLRLTVVLLTSKQNEYVWCLHRTVLPYFLICAMSSFILNKIYNLQHSRRCKTYQILGWRYMWMMIYSWWLKYSPWNNYCTR